MPGERLQAIDAARGIALALMIAYHFCFDLNYFGVIRVDFNHSFPWLAFRACIVSLFLVVSGISLVLAGGRERGHFLKRQGRLLAAALLVSAGSYLLFPGSYIYFGILHFIFVAGFIGRLFVPLGRLVPLGAGIAVLAIGVFYSNAVFDAPFLHWFGLMTYKPDTEDYVPLFPWLGVVLVGVSFGRLLERRKSPSCSCLKPLAAAGRHSLAIYLIHQPVLLGLLYLALK